MPHDKRATRDEFSVYDLMSGFMKSTSVSHTLLLDQQANRSKESAAKAAEDFQAMLDPGRFQTSTSAASTASGSQVTSSVQPSPGLTRSSKLIQKAKGFTIYHNKRFYPLKRSSAGFHPLPLHPQQSVSPSPRPVADRQHAVSHQAQQHGPASAAHDSPSFLTRIKDWFSALLFGDSSQSESSSTSRQTDSSRGIANSVLGLVKHFGHLFADTQGDSKTEEAPQTRASASSGTKGAAIDNRAVRSSENFAGLKRQGLPAAANRAGPPAHPLSAAKALRHKNVSEQIHQVIKDSSAKYGLPARLVAAVVKVESGFNPHAVSPAGAKGLMQLMPATAHDLRVKNCFDIEENVDAGCRYLKRLLDQFDGKVQLALAAYNAGSGAVKEYGGVPPYHETRRYVRKVLAYL